jgi:putative ABC transport system ATP-binding protein
MIIMDKIVLQTIGLGRSYRVGRETVHALENVEMSVAQGEFIAIVGPSGSGKSTLLNLLGGLDQPTSGNVLLDGHDLANYNEEQLAALRRQKLGFIFQRHDLFPELLVRENVEFPLLLNDTLSDERRQRADSLLELVGLSKKGEALPEELSGGQQQRVGIARSLANMPLILLADEPTGNLDSATSAEIVGVLIDLTHRQGLTLVMVTHDPEVASRADRILTMLDGHLSAQVNEVREK